jgi:hypothetical protein
VDLGATEAATLATARLLFDKFGRQGMEGIADLLDPGCVGTPSFGNGGPLRGREEILAWTRQWSDRGLKVEARPLGYEVVGRFAIVHGSLRRRKSGALTENQVYWRFEIEDGRVVAMDSFPSRAAAVAELEVAA